MKVILVTGSVATGKTTLAKKLAEKLNYKYIDVNKIIKKYNLSESYDKKRKTKIIDVKKLNKYLIKEISNTKEILRISVDLKRSFKLKKANRKQSNKKIKNGLVIDSHLSHYLPKKYVDLCIVTKCDLKVLEKRLKKRNYTEQKIRENLDAEIFDVCLEEAKGRGHKIIVIDATKDINKGVSSVVKNLC